MEHRLHAGSEMSRRCFAVVVLGCVAGIVLRGDPRITAASFGGSGISYNFIGSHGSASDTITQVSVDKDGNIYLAGTTYSTDFPQVQGLQTAPVTQCTFNCGFRSLFAAKVGPDGQTIRYRTYISAPSDHSPAFAPPPLLPAALAVDADGNAYIGGATTGEMFPSPDGTVKRITTAGGTDAFLLKLDPNGRVIGSMFMGGKDDDAFTSIVLGSDGFMYLAGTTKSVDFPITAGAYRATHSGGPHAFVTKVRLPGNTVVFTALLGQAAGQLTSAEKPIIRVDAAGSAYVAVTTNSPDWPVTAGTAQPQCAGSSCSDIVIARLSAAGDRVVYCTYLGGTGAETTGGLAVDGAGNAWIAGTTWSEDFPTTAGAFQRQRVTPQSSAPAAFVAKLNAQASRLEYSTYLDGSDNEEGRDIVVDSQGIAYVGGRTTSKDFPLRNAVQVGLVNGICPEYTLSGSIPIRFHFCGGSGFVAALNPQGSGLVWSTNIGGGTVFALAVDSQRRVYMGGKALDPMPSGPGSASVVRFEPAVVSLQFAPNAITNAASFRPGLPHPGGLASIFVEGLDVTGTLFSGAPPLPLELGGVSIAVGGADAPILAVADLGGGRQQINFQVPFEAQSNRVAVRYKGLTTFVIPETVGPGIFSLPNGEGALQHADYSPVTPSNPAKAGEVIIAYLTGFGRVRPAVTTGTAPAGPAVLNPNCSWSQLSASIGRVEYAGVTPGYVGLYQVNMRLPATVQPGSHDLTIYWNGCWPVGAPPENYARSNAVKLYLQ